VGTRWTKGIAHTRIKSAFPHLNGKVERSHRIDAEEFYRMLAGIVIDDAGVFNDKLREWRTTTTTIARTAPSAAKPYESLSQKTQPWM
jgi:hypothetical protein